MGIMITYHGYNNGHNNPVSNAHKNMGVYYTWQKNSDFISTIERFLFYYYNLPLPKYYTYFVKSALFFF